MWGLSEGKANARCIHYMRALTFQSHCKSITELANMRQAEAKVEMLKHNALHT